jgi:poly-gamma-glutamate synthesis protein (capsule biosynthesis protein)
MSEQRALRLAWRVFLGAAGVWAVAAVMFGSGRGRAAPTTVSRPAAPAASVTTLPRPEETTRAAEQRPATLVFVGDLMLGRNVEGLTDQYGPDYPFAKIGDTLKSAGLAVANLEGPIVSAREHRRTPTGSTSFNFAPDTAVALKRAGIDLVSLANNHTLDRGAAGFTETVDRLNEAGVFSIGHPKEVATDRVAVRTVNGHGIAFIAMQDVFASLNEGQAVELVRQVASEHPDAFVIAMVHWGDEYKLRHNARQERLAHAFIDAGADLIIGHHPHVVQDIEAYKNRAIFYSLGNFIFDQYFSRETQEGLAVQAELTDSTVTYRLAPIDIVKSQPTLMVGEQHDQWLSAVAARSNPTLSTQIKAGTIGVTR